MRSVDARFLLRLERAQFSFQALNSRRSSFCCTSRLCARSRTRCRRSCSSNESASRRAAHSSERLARARLSVSKCSRRERMTGVLSFKTKTLNHRVFLPVKSGSQSFRQVVLARRLRDRLTDFSSDASCSSNRAEPYRKVICSAASASASRHDMLMRDPARERRVYTHRLPTQEPHIRNRGALRLEM